MIHHGDCLNVMATFDAESIDAIVTDPPYGLGFMGKAWDRAHQHEPWAREALRVAKPGAYLLAFGGTRTVHRMACAIEDAGWIIRDLLVWGYASGFPKGRANLKPAWEPIVMARKPGPLRMLAIDECRIALVDGDAKRGGFGNGGIGFGGDSGAGAEWVDRAEGRWPANVLLTSPIFDGGWDGVVGGGETTTNSTGAHSLAEYERNGVTGWGSDRGRFYGQDYGTYSRFFLIPKAARSDREPVLGGAGGRVVSVWGGDEDDLTPGKKSTVARRNVHPTVKPVDLMRHLVRLVTPPGGTVLDPFLGSGTTGLAAEMEGFAWIGIEKEAEYVAIAEARLNGTQKGLAL